MRFHRSSRLLTLTLIGAALLVTGAHHRLASAASFDCAQAKTAIEKIICADPNLSRADESLAQDYKAALSVLPAGARKSVQQGQRDWLKWLKHICGEAADKAVEDASRRQDAVNCLISAYTTRMTDLKNMGPIPGPYQLTRVDRFVLYPPWPEESAHPYKNIGYPQILTPVTADTKHWNDWIAAQYQLFLDENEEDSGAQIDVSYRITYVTEGFIALSRSSWYYGLGAAHGGGGEVQLNYLLTQRRPLRAEDLFDPSSQWQENLRQMAVVSIKENLARDGVDPNEWSESALGQPTDPEIWRITPAGLDLVYSPETIGPYAMGQQEVHFPWWELKPYLKDSLPFALPDGALNPP